MASPSDNKSYVMGYPKPDPQAQQPPPPPGYPYPVQMPYQPGPYPPPPPPSYGGAPPPPMNGWYASGPAVWPGSDEDRAKRLGRAMLITMVTLIISMVVFSLVIWYLFGMRIPEFRVSSLSVTNLNVSDAWITANWAANVTVFNPNAHVKVSFDPIRASIFYRNSPLGMSPAGPVYLPGTRVESFPINLGNQTAVSRPSLTAEMAEDQKMGFCMVSLRMSLGAKFTSRSIWRMQTLRVFCEDIKVNLAPKGGEGTLAEDAQTECMILT